MRRRRARTVPCQVANSSLPHHRAIALAPAMTGGSGAAGDVPFECWVSVYCTPTRDTGLQGRSLRTERDKLVEPAIECQATSSPVNFRHPTPLRCLPALSHRPA